MRHLGLRATIGMLALAGGMDGSAASPLDFLFGGPPLASRPAYRLRRRPAPPLTQRQRASEPQAEIPLPVPRPHFPGDPPAGMAQAERTTKPPETTKPEPTKPEPDKPEPAKPTAAPDRTAKTTDATPVEPGTFPPLPPPKPADLAPPAEPAAKSEPPKGEVPKAEIPKTEVPKAETAKPEPTRPATPTRPVTPSPAPTDTAKGPAAPPTPPPKPPEIAKPGTPPAVAPSGATTAFTPRSPEDDPQCPSRLVGEKIDVVPTTIGPQPDDRCTVVQPVRLGGVTLADGGKVDFPEHPTIACTTADSFGSFVRDLLVPLAKGTFGAPVTAVWTGPGLECRSRDHVFGAKLSAHGQGLAIDIAKLKLADGRLVEVGTPKTDAETAFETAARAGACGYFHTVLGPGSDSYHRTHWHFDLEVRGSKGDSKYCK